MGRFMNCPYVLSTHIDRVIRELPLRLRSYDGHRPGIAFHEALQLTG